MKAYPEIKTFQMGLDYNSTNVQPYGKQKALNIHQYNTN